MADILPKPRSGRVGHAARAKLKCIRDANALSVNLAMYLPACIAGLLATTTVQNSGRTKQGAENSKRNMLI